MTYPLLKGSERGDIADVAYREPCDVNESVRVMLVLRLDRCRAPTMPESSVLMRPISSMSVRLHGIIGSLSNVNMPPAAPFS